MSRSETDCVQTGHISGVSRHRKKPFGLFLEVRGAEMEACRILIPLRGLRFGGGPDFGGNRREYQCCHRQERNRCFINVIIHDNLHSKHDAKGISADFQGSKATVRPGKARAMGVFLEDGIRGKDSVNFPLSDLGTLCHCFWEIEASRPPDTPLPVGHGSQIDRLADAWTVPLSTSFVSVLFIRTILRYQNTILCQ
jgi:hypothetical protein